MEHNCHRCGAVVEDGKPFCAQCGAPQIRVTIQRPEDEPPLGDLASRQRRSEVATGPLLPGTPDEVQPPAEPVLPSGSRSNTPPLPTIGLPTAEAPPKLVRSAALRSAMLVGVIAGISMLLPQLLPLLAPLRQSALLINVVAGVIGVGVYRARISRVVAGREGFRLGALTGLFCSIPTAIVSIVAVQIPEGRTELIKQLDAQLATAMARNSDPASQEMMTKMAAWLHTPDGFATMFMIQLVVLVLLFMLLSGLGGLLGASLFGRKDPRSNLPGSD